jgi:amino acid transporter
MATAVVEERQLLKSLRWWDGFVIAMCNPGFLISELGFSIGALGTTGAVILWLISAAIGMLQAWIYAETAAMFPEKPGGISLYAHEGWRGRFSLVGPMGAFGYWIGWSVVLSIFGRLIGDLIMGQWFPTHSGTSLFSDGVITGGVTPNILIGIGCIVLVWFLNVFGIRPAVWVSYVTGAGLLLPLGLIIIVPYLTGHWHSVNMTWALHGYSGFKLAMVFLFLFGWSSYAAEVCATFSPEYKDTRRDTTIAIRSAAMFTLVVFCLFPLGMGGLTGPNIPAAAQEGGFYTTAFAAIVGHGWASFFTVLLIGSLFLSMISSTADGSRALYGIARDDMTVKQLHHLNRFHVPARAMTVDLVVNVGLLLLISSNLAILYLSNIGYITAHFLALTGFLWLRKDRPNWPRPIKVGKAWVGIAAVCAVIDAALIVYGLTNPGLAYGVSTKDTWIGLGVLVGSVLLFVFRRLVQDRKRITLREEVPTMPTPQQMEYLQQEMTRTAR